MSGAEDIRSTATVAFGSNRHGSSGWGNNNTSKVFSRSSRSIEEDEALKWAAIEKLPTFTRVRRGILTLQGQKPKEVDIQSLGQEERRLLLQRLSHLAEDNEKFLWKLKNRMDRVGIESPTIEVRYENLSLQTETHIGKGGVPTNIKFFTSQIEGFLNFLRVWPSRKRSITILHDLNGIIKPSRLTLLLGPPGSGKTSFLLALAGKLDPKLKASGTVTYNGHGMHEFVPQRTSAYIGQNDVHTGQMTVRETLQFSARCQGSRTRYEMLMELSRREREQNVKPDPDIDLYMKASALKGQEEVITDYIIKLLGLEMCADALIGDQMVRGISGGERKRVTTGEMIVGPARALFMDEISTGLDSSTTFQIVNALRQSVHILNSTAVIALLQPAPETYALFDDIILISEGQIVYQGPREAVVDFFASKGFKCPDRKGVADFLQEVTSRKDQEQYWARQDEAYRFVSIKEFAEGFDSFHVGRQLKEELRTPFDRERSHPSALSTSTYGVSKIELLKACASAELLLMRRNWFVYVFKLLQLMFVALVIMTLFLRTNMPRRNIEDGGIFLGVLYIALMTHMYNGYAELAMSLMRLPVFYKQRDFRFYPAWAYALPAWILRIPVSLVECALWTGLTYYVIGLDPNIQRMFRHYVLLVLLSQMAFALFRLIAALGRNMVIASTFGNMAQLVLVVLGGFIISREDIKSWWIWVYWASPMMYAQNAIVVNEFLGHSWSQVVDLLVTKETLGVLVLKTRGFFYHASWYWIGVGAMIGYICLFNILFMLALDYLDPFQESQILSEETLREKEFNRTGAHQELSSISNGLQPESGKRDESKSRRGMVLPFTPYSIVFESIKYSVDMPPEMKAEGVIEGRLLLLNDLNGTFRPGVLTALMGVSGAGKTTLLDVLAGRKTGGYIEGNIKISGYPKKQETFARISGYCEQNDIHSPHVTVYESLLFSAWLRLPSDVNAETRKMFIEEVMELVELTFLRGAIVGLPAVNGLSTEQRKRLTIAVELVANPSIIFMDEPTSGLDARAAAIVMRTVRNTVDTGRTVVCTIHQPGIDIFEAFDELFLMKRGGEEIYVGPVGHQSSQLIRYFEGINGIKKIPKGYNPATWMLEISASEQEESLGINFTEIYKNSELFRTNLGLVRNLSQPAPGAKDIYFHTQHSQPFFTQCIACFWKQNKSYWRNTHYSAIRILFTLISALLFGTIFWDLGQRRSTSQDLFNALGALYASVLFIGIQNSLMVQPVVDIERTVFYREKAAGLYSAMPYAFGQVGIEIPYVMFQTLLCGVVVYAMINFHWTVTKFFWFIFFFFTSNLYFTLYGMMAVALTPNSHISTIVAAAFYNLWNSFSGFVIPRNRMPVWWRWYFWACPVSWTLYGLIASQFGRYEDVMEDTGETVKEFLRRYFGYQEDFVGTAAAVSVGFCILFTFVFAFGIKMFNFQKR
ncbi:ABC transporter G family member 39-like isoform X2 [Wolffia australiana]